MPAAPDPTLHTAALAALEAAANRALALSPTGSATMAPLEDCVFAFHCTAPALDCYLYPGADGVRLAGVHQGPVTSRLTGTAAELAANPRVMEAYLGTASG